MLECPSKPLWLLVAVLFAVDITWMIAAGFTLEASPFLAILLFAALVSGVSYYYTVHRPNPQFSTLLNCTVYLIAFTNALALLSYFSASLNLTFLDAQFAAIDKAMGFDWIEMLRWTNEHPTIGWTLTFAYMSSIPQLLIVVLILSFTMRLEEVKDYTALFAITGTIVIVTAAILPAEGAYVYYAPDPSLFSNLNPDAGLWHHVQLQALRDGTMRHIDVSVIEGLVTFPSFHTALAIITTWAVRDVKYVFPVAAVLNALVIWSTLSEGGHHLIDVFAGAFIAVASIAVYTSRRGIFTASTKPLASGKATRANA